jgi:SAM-dependent methyltransferase
MEGYDPVKYWSDRLAGSFDLRGTGHWMYSEQYNRWLYRAKRRALRRALTALRPPLRALDVGSGTGWVVEQLLAWGATVDGSDIAEPALAGLRRRHPGLDFFELAIGTDAVPRPDGAYDLVTAFDVLYHVTDDARWNAAVQELARVLRPRGRLVVTDGLDADDRQPAPHVRFRSAERWTEAATAAGLELATTGPLFRWLSRNRQAAGFRRLPDGLRGPLEYSLERLAPRRPHMRWAVLVKTAPTRTGVASERSRPRG